MDMLEMMCNFLDTPCVIDEVVLNYVESVEEHEINI